MRARPVMYEQSHEPVYGARPSKERFDADYDCSLADKRYAASDVYGRRVAVPAHAYPGTTDAYQTSGPVSAFAGAGRPSDSKMLVNVGGVRHEIL